jgi:hypothetical protein
MTEFSLLMGNINGQMTQLNSTFEDLRVKVNGFLDWVPDSVSWVLEPLKAARDKFSDICQKLWKEISDFCTDPGDPGRLNDAAKTFSDKVQAGVSAQAGKFTETYMQVDNKWKGDAAGAAAYAISEMSDAATTFRTQNNGNDHLAGGKWPPSGVAAS